VSDLQTCVAFRDFSYYRVGTLNLGSLVSGGLEEQAASVASILPQPEGIVTPTRSAEEALDRLASSHIFHYAGPEMHSWGRKPMDCAFMLDSELKICDIVHTPLRHPVLAYMSQGFGLIDLTPGLATGMLLAGFKSTVTTTCVTKQMPP
jgi:hypothetical protein